MRIISKFKDYYDIVMEHGIDDDIIYLREQKQHEFDASRFDTGHKRFLYDKGFSFSDLHECYAWSTDKKCFKYDVKLIGFCGKLYPVVRIFTDLENNRWTKPVGCYNEQDVDKILDENKILKAPFKELYWTDQDRYSSYWVSGIRYRHNKLTEVFKQSNECFDIHDTYNVPSFVLYHDYSLHKNFIITNPPLKEYGFFRMFEPFQTYQEIEMFIGGRLLAPVPPMIEISEKLRVAKKGFNEWSFRRLPTKKK